MTLNDLLRGKGIDPEQVLVLRHTPWEPKLRKELPHLAMERPDLFNAYQETQKLREEKKMERAKFVASFIGHTPGRAVFVGMYENTGSRSITRSEFLEAPETIELKKYGARAFAGEIPRRRIRWFELVLTDFYAHRKGKLIISWPRPDVAWARFANEPKNEMPIVAVLTDCALGAKTADWNAVDHDAEELGGHATPTPINEDYESGGPERVMTNVYRVLRDTLMARRVKQLHNYECQICGKTLNLPDGREYAEAHHIKPLGKPHNGPDQARNILCLCPNHHAELDYSVREISAASIRSVGGHTVAQEFIDYHNRRVSELRARHCKPGVRATRRASAKTI